MSKPNVIKGYHYTRSLEKIMKEGLVPKTSLVADILPHDFRDFLIWADIEEDWRSFLSMPKDAYFDVTKGLLEPRPDSWYRSEEYPGLWGKLMRAFFPCDYPSADFITPANYSDADLYVLEISLTDKDSAWVVEEGYSRAIHDYKLPVDLQPGFLRNPTIENKRIRANQIREFVMKYYESRISIFEYTENYNLPLLTVGNIISPERLKVHSVIKGKDIPEISHG